MSKQISRISVTAMLALAGAASAGPCTYSEALLALQQGNTVRGMALMRMASYDGDRRAMQYLTVAAGAVAQEPKPLPAAEAAVSLARR